MVTKAQYLDPVQFGRWVSERRRALGWPSQRALSEATEHDPVTRESGITESFLARLEAGVLVWPPRGGVRHRVIELAWFLCETPRAVASYLQLAGCARPTDDERALIARITSYISASTADVPILLPPRPPRLIGRDAVVSMLLEQLLALDGGCCAVTGMIGAGKSAVAAEVLHSLARDRRRRAYYFPDGIISLSEKHRYGLDGLLTMLAEICAICTPDADTSDTKRGSRWLPHLIVSSAPPDAGVGTEVGERGIQAHGAPASASDLAAAINRTRYALAGKRLLLLLDDLDPRFPLAEALDALLASGALHGQHDEEVPRQRITVLVTSRAAVDSPFVKARVQVAPLEVSSSVALFAELVGRPLSEREGAAAARLCAGLAHLPFAIELAASAVRTDGIPIELLAQLVEQRPLDLSWHGGEILREQLAGALTSLRPEARTTLALLPLLGSRTFSLSAAAISLSGARDAVLDAHTPDGDDNDSATTLANVAAALGQLVRNSLLDLVSPPDDDRTAAERSQHSAPDHGQPRYQISPLLQAYAREELNALDPEQRERAYQNVQAYASDIVERLPAPEMLRHGWPIVMSAFTRSLHAGHEQQMLDLVGAVSRQPIVMLRFQEQMHFILDAGIAASRRADNRHALVQLLSRLGVFHYYQGSVEAARRAWTESAQIAESLPLSCGLNVANYNLAVLSLHLGDYSAARELLEKFMACAATSAHNGDLAYAYAARAEVFHRQGQIDRALADLSALEERLAECGRGEPWGEAWLDSMVQHLRLERARVLGLYAQTRELADALACPCQPTIAAAQIALDQAQYAAQRGFVDDARMFARRAADLGKDVRSGFFLAHAQSLLEHVGERAVEER